MAIFHYNLYIYYFYINYLKYNFISLLREPFWRFAIGRASHVVSPVLFYDRAYCFLVEFKYQDHLFSF